MKQRNEYAVKLDVFEGPLELLLYLVSRAEVDIKDISVAQIAKQYIEYLDLMRDFNINVASEYLSMAATLVRLKARELLPDTEVEALDEEEGIYSRQQLIEKLLEYKKFKEAANSLRIYESENIGSFSRGKMEEIETELNTEDRSLESITVFDLIAAFKNVLERMGEDDSDPKHIVRPDVVRIDDRIEFILCRIEENDEIFFEDLFRDDRRKIVMVVTFMAILELVKMKRILFRQQEQFGALLIRKRVEKESKQKEISNQKTEEGTPAIEEGSMINEQRTVTGEDETKDSEQ